MGPVDCPKGRQPIPPTLRGEELNLRSINKIQKDATVCRYLFTEKLLYMFRVSIAPITDT